MKAKDLREKSPEDLNELLKTTDKAVFDVRFRNFTNRLDDTSAIRKARRERARILTLQHERVLAAEPTAAVEAFVKAEKPAVAAKPAAAKKAKAAAPKAEAKSDSAGAKAEKKPVAKKTTKKSEAK